MGPAAGGKMRPRPAQKRQQWDPIAAKVSFLNLLNFRGTRMQR
jgi:hypothetical protein